MNVTIPEADAMDEWGDICDADADCDHEHEESELGPKLDLSGEEFSAIQQLADLETSAAAVSAHVSAIKEANGATSTISTESSSSSSSAPAHTAAANVATATGSASSSTSPTPAPTSASLSTSASHDPHSESLVPLNGDIPKTVALAASSLDADDLATAVQN